MIKRPKNNRGVTLSFLTFRAEIRAKR